MYYPDLTYYRIGYLGEKSTVYLHLRNIGWLDSKHPYAKGLVSNLLIKKIKELLFLKLKNAEDREKKHLISIKLF